MHFIHMTQYNKSDLTNQMIFIQNNFCHLEIDNFGNRILIRRQGQI